MAGSDDAATTATTTTALIEFRGVWKSFGPKVVLRGVDLDVRRGETLTILGASGSGKSVMLKMLIGLMPIDQGEIVFDGASVGGMDAHALAHLRQRVGMVFQGAALFDSDSVGDNVAYGLHEHHARDMDDAAIAARVSWALESVGLGGTEALHPDELSGGMRKRAGIARTIAVRPEVILYDEPTMGLDPINSTRIGHLIAQLKAQLHVTSVIVTHDMPLAFAVSDRIALLYEGQIVAVGSTEQIKQSADARVRDFVTGRAEDEPKTRRR